MKPAIRVENLSKQYKIGRAQRGAYRTLREAFTEALASPFRAVRGKSEPKGEPFRALQDVSFEVQPGEVVGIIGRNGAGKSTLLKILSRITEPTEGRIEVRGRMGSLLEVGTGFHPELTGRDNIYLNGSILGMHRREIARKFDEIVAFSEVERFLDTPVKRYSSGMYVRLAFAVAAHLDPEVMIVDEVLAVGDATFQKKCLGKLGEVGRSGRTVLFVSHNMGAILALCGKAVLLERGRLVFAGKCSDAVARYARQDDAYVGNQVDLTQHPGRQKGRAGIFRQVRLLDGDGSPLEQLRSGDPLVLEFLVSPVAGHPLLNFRVCFETHQGVTLFNVSTLFSGDGPARIEEPQRVSCRLDTVPLAPGRYRISLHAGAPNYPGLDSILDAIDFEVVGSDFYGSGSMPKAEFGPFVVRSCWQNNLPADDSKKDNDLESEQVAR